MAQTKHEVDDRQKYRAIRQFIHDADGKWPDALPPLLRNDNYELLTGSHRYAAAKAEGLNDSQIPMIEIPKALYNRDDLYDLDDYQLAEALAEIGEADLAAIACDDWANDHKPTRS